MARANVVYHVNYYDHDFWVSFLAIISLDLICHQEGAATFYKTFTSFNLLVL